VTNLIVPSNLGRHANADIYVEYANAGEVAMPAPLLVLHGSDRALMKLASLEPLDVAMVIRMPTSPSRATGYSDTVQFTASGKTNGFLQPVNRAASECSSADWSNPGTSATTASASSWACSAPTTPRCRLVRAQGLDAS